MTPLTNLFQLDFIPDYSFILSKKNKYVFIYCNNILLFEDGGFIIDQEFLSDNELIYIHQVNEEIQ